MLDSLCYHKHYPLSEQTHCKDLKVWNSPFTTTSSFFFSDPTVPLLLLIFYNFFCDPIIFPDNFLHHGYSYLVSPFLLPCLYSQTLICHPFFFVLHSFLCCVDLASMVTDWVYESQEAALEFFHFYVIHLKFPKITKTFLSASHCSFVNFHALTKQHASSFTQ